MFEVGTVSTFIPVAALSAVILGYFFYQWLLPKPIPGIPYNEASAKRLLGDVPDLVEHVNRTQQIWPWIASHATKFNSPIFQLWTRPFGKPWVIVCDFPESQDILMRRTKEFDRSSFFGDVFAGVIPDHHIRKKSQDPMFKHNRALMKDLMTPGFLNEVSAPHIYAAVETLLELWKTKMSIAKGHPFTAIEDIYNGAMDIIFAATFGFDPDRNMLLNQKNFLESARVSLPDDINKPVDLPKAEPLQEFESVLTLTESLESVIKSISPSLHAKLLNYLPSMRKATAIKENLISTEIDKGIERMKSGDQFKRCAVDDVLRRETGLAKKEDRLPNYQTREIKDELFGFLVGGHDTTSTTVCWGLKNLTDNPDSQTHLRDEMRKAFPSAIAEKRNPTTHEIVSTHLPYIDAVIEEVVRTSGTTAGTSRSAMVDTVIFGHHIPKGTEVFLMSNGPGYLSPAFPVDDALRHESAKSDHEKGRKVGVWPGDAAEMSAFKPERWLVTDEKGNEHFDGNAGPIMTFGLGPRGCYGRRLAYLEMRIMFTMIIWNFRLMKCPEELSGYERVDKLTVKPTQFYLRLEKVEHEE